MWIVVTKRKVRVFFCVVLFIFVFTFGIHYVRTCSNNLQLRIPLAMVCMKESRPGNGQLCLCSESRCHASVTIHGASFTLWLSILTVVLLHCGQTRKDAVSALQVPRELPTNGVIAIMTSPSQTSRSQAGSAAILLGLKKRWSCDKKWVTAVVIA